jgi:hypothetical protein
MHTTRTTRHVAHAWHLTSPIAATSAADIARTATDNALTLVGHPATLAGMCRALTPFGPLATASSLIERVLGCAVDPDRSIPEGFITACQS